MEYKLKDTVNNRNQYEAFLKQYKEFEELEEKSETIENFLKINKYRLSVIWENDNVPMDSKLSGVNEDSKEKTEKVLKVVKSTKPVLPKVTKKVTKTIAKSEAKK